MSIQRPVSKQPIPRNARCVFSGIIFDVYQWRQKLFDGSFATFEKLKRVDTVNVIPITNEGKIVLLKQEQPGKNKFIGFAGGRIDKDESPLSAAKRELLEETGMAAKRLVLWKAFQPSGLLDWAIYTFIAKGCRAVAKPTPEAGEKITLQYVSFEQLVKVVERKDFRDTEITLDFLRAKTKPGGLERIKQLFIG